MSVTHPKRSDNFPERKLAIPDFLCRYTKLWTMHYLLSDSLRHFQTLQPTFCTLPTPKNYESPTLFRSCWETIQPFIYQTKGILKTC